MTTQINHTNTPNQPPPKTTKPACSACSIRKKTCTAECILAPYFPKGQEKQYKNAHALYGFKNMKKMLEAIPDASSQKDCVTSLKYEADALAQDPSKGCCQEVDDLLQQLQMANDQLQEVKQKLYERPADR
ncbi:LOB domain-containing protein 27 [Tanacetum coccineum]